VIEIISSNPAFIDLLSLSEISHFTTTEILLKDRQKLIESVFNKVVKISLGTVG